MVAPIQHIVVAFVMSSLTPLFWLGVALSEESAVGAIKWDTSKWDVTATGPTTYSHSPVVRALVDNVKARWAVSANTYVGHAGGEENSVDFWGFGGRGDPIEKAVGSAIHAHLIQTYPAINWIIWDGIYTGPDGTYPDPSGWGHYDHVHVTIGSSDSEGKTIERTLSSR